MARIRGIKPEIWQDEKLAPLDPTTRLVWAFLISHADDAGRHVDSVKTIDGILFSKTDDTCRASLQTLASIGSIRRGKSASGQSIIQLVNWAKHQKIQHPNLKSCLPEIAAAPHEPLMNGSCAAHDSTFNLQPSTTNPHAGEVPPEGKPEQKTDDLNAQLKNALASLNGTDPKKLTGTAWGGIQKCLTSILKISPDATPAEIDRRAANYRLRFPNAALTAQALDKWWGDCDTRPGNHPANQNPIVATAEQNSKRIDKLFEGRK